MPLPVITDPDFRHGAGGVCRGCGCQTCRDDTNRKARLRRKLTECGDRVMLTRPEMRELTAHLDGLLVAVPTASDLTIARAAGLSHAFLGRLRRGDGMRRDTGARLRALQPHDLTAHLGLVPAGRSVFLIRSLQAAGYSVRWQADQIGTRGLKTMIVNVEAGLRTNIRRDYADRIEQLAATFGWRAAAPEDGLPPRAITQARAWGAAAGAHPLFAYDDNGQLNPRAIPGHPWSQLDERCARRLDVLRAVAAGRNDDEVADLTGLSSRGVVRLRGSLGLRLTDPQRPQVLARIKQTIDEYDYGDLDPVQAVLDLGALDIKHMVRLTRDHPVLVAWQNARQKALAA